MEFLAFHNQCVPHLASNDQEDNLFPLDIIQGTKIACPQFVLGQRVFSQTLDRFRGRRGPVLQAGLDSRFEDSLLTYWQ
jgi:hypothetical protein